MSISLLYLGTPCASGASGMTQIKSGPSPRVGRRHRQACPGPPPPRPPVDGHHNQNGSMNMAVSTSFADIGASGKEALQTLFITGVKNAHALEKEARQILSRQIERVTNYPEVAQKLRMHLDETNRQEERIDEILHALGEDRSLLKDWATQIMGNMAAVAHVPMADEILKDTFANHAFEAFEIAAYKSLITMAEATGNTQFVAALRQSLEEEERMRQWIEDNVEKVTRMYLEREARGEKADR